MKAYIFSIYGGIGSTLVLFSTDNIGLAIASLAFYFGIIISMAQMLELINKK
jgi:hypothetical protein